AAGALPAEASFALRAALVRAVLERAPGHAEAGTLVRAALPPGLPLPAAFDALEWLDFAEAARATPIRVVTLPEKGEKDLSPQQRELGSARHTWRPDLVALESKQLLVITPVEKPGRIAKCLA